MRVNIQNGDWGAARNEEIQKTLESTIGVFLEYFSHPIDGSINVTPTDITPIVWHRQRTTDPFSVELTAKNLYWAQYAYQFAHEVCHIQSDFERLQEDGANRWFDESLCELASLFTLRSMAELWRKSPPYPHWQEWAPNLGIYADNTMSGSKRQLANGEYLAKWHAKNDSALRSDRYLRDLNGIVAAQMLPVIEANPNMWQSIRFIPDSNATFDGYLLEWRANCPDELKGFPESVSVLFGFGD